MSKEKAIELIQGVINDNIDNISFGDIKHNKLLRTTNAFLRCVLTELRKSDWVSVEEELPPYDEEVLVCNENEPSDMWFGHRTSDRRVVVDEHEFAKGYGTITHWRKIDKLEE